MTTSKRIGRPRTAAYAVKQDKSLIGSKGALIRAKCYRGEELLFGLRKMVLSDEPLNKHDAEHALNMLQGKFEQIIDAVEEGS